MMLPFLPPELLWAIWDKLESLGDKNAFVRTCRSHLIFNRALYRDLISSKRKMKSAMTWSAWHGRETCMQKLLDNGADARANDVADITTDHPEDGYYIIDLETQEDDVDSNNPVPSSTPLACAARRGHSGVAQLLVDAGADPNAHGHGGADDLPVMWAVCRANVEVLAVLLAAGADAHIDMCGWETLLAYAATRGHAEIARLLLAQTAPYTTRQREDALVDAICHGHEDVIRVFIDAGIDINSFISAGQCLLDVARGWGSDRIVNFFLDLGADIELADDHGNTPLHKAITTGHRISAMILLDRGAIIETRDNIGFTPLASAVIRDRSEMVEVLLERNANTEARTEDGDTSLLLAARYCLIKPLRLLLSRKADPSALDRMGYTSLCLAVMTGHEGVVQALLSEDDSGVACPSRCSLIDTPDPLNRTPLFLGTMYGHTKIVRMLLDYGSQAIETRACAGRSPLSFAQANKDKTLPRKGLQENIQSISDLLQDQSLMTAATPRLRDLSAPQQNGDEDGKRHEEADHVECKACLAPISGYDEPSVCATCTDVYATGLGLCLECRAVGRACHDGE
jgi:ankyrin repeat protein